MTVQANPGSLSHCHECRASSVDPHQTQSIVVSYVVVVVVVMLFAISSTAYAALICCLDLVEH